MNQVIHSLGGITIEAGGAVLAHAAGYEVKSGRAMTAVRPYGSTEPLAFLPGTVTHILQLEQIKWEQPADFYTMSNFSVKITRNGQAVQYAGCEWTAVEEATRRERAGERKPREGGATMKQETRTVAAAVRAPEEKPSLRREKAPEIAESGTVTEVILQDAATLETELSALQRRKLRLAPEMDRCGEPLY